MNSASPHIPLRGRALLERINIRELPKVLLHEHLDGCLRPSTVIELAAETGYSGLATTDPAELAAWFHRGAQRGNLPEYLEGFQHTIAVMQTAEALERVAFEFIEDMHEFLHHHPCRRGLRPRIHLAGAAILRRSSSRSCNPFAR